MPWSPPRTSLAALALSFAGLSCSARHASSGGPLQATAARACFPVEALADSDRVFADRILLDIADREGLYTLADGLKPVSSDVRDLRIRIAPTLDTARLRDLDRLRRVSGVLHCGDIGVFVQVFTSTFTARDSSVMRSASLVVYHRAAVRALIRRQALFFGRLGVTESTDPQLVVAAVENAPRAERWRGYGYLFGYPDEAVDFFVRAGVEGDSTQRLVHRDFRRIDTVQRYPATQGGPAVTPSFVYAVPKGAGESEGDRALRLAAAPKYARYLARRAQFIRADSTGAVALWRQWFAP
jgi:hypothetical protein